MNFPVECMTRTVKLILYKLNNHGNISFYLDFYSKRGSKIYYYHIIFQKIRFRQIRKHFLTFKFY